jgi:hypothetical protein
MASEDEECHWRRRKRLRQHEWRPREEPDDDGKSPLASREQALMLETGCPTEDSKSSGDIENHREKA